MQNKISAEPTKLFPNTEKVQETWNNCADGFSKIPAYTTLNIAMNFISLLNIPEAKNILEMGCGNGDFAVEIVTHKNPSANYQAFDLAPNFVNDTATKLSHLDLNYKGNYLQALNDIKSKKLDLTKPKQFEDKVILFENLKTSLSLGDAENLPAGLFPDNSYDVV